MLSVAVPFTSTGARSTVWFGVGAATVASGATVSGTTGPS
jgi:hypothetical protein